MCQAHGLSLLEPFVPIDTGEIHRAGVHAQYQDTVATLISRVQALEGALRSYVTRTSALEHALDYACDSLELREAEHPRLVGWRALLDTPVNGEQLVAGLLTNAPAGESVRTDGELLDYFSNPNRRLIGYVEPYWYVFKQADTEVDSKHTDIRAAINTAMDLTTTETTNDHDEG
jgi:hypothetical protein